MEYPKLSEELIRRCRSNCMKNEMIIVPGGRDYGQEDYYRCKIDSVVTSENSKVEYFRDEEEKLIVLPGPDEDRSFVEKALDSVENFCSLSTHPSCIMFDVSAYAMLPDHRNIRDLIEVMHDDYGFRCVFLLLSTSSGMLFRRLEIDLGITTSVLKKPSNRTMADYFKWLFEEPCDSYDKLILENMSSFVDFQGIDDFMGFLERSGEKLSEKAFGKWNLMRGRRFRFGY